MKDHEPARRVPRTGLWAAALYLLLGVGWLTLPEQSTLLLAVLIPPLFLAAFAASAVVPAWRAERNWVRAGVGTAAGAFLLAWVALLALEALSGTGMLGCRMHEVDEGGLPDAVCMGPLPFFSSGRRAWWLLPVVAFQAGMAAFVFAAAARALRWTAERAFRRLGRPLPAPSRRATRAATVLAWAVPGTLVAGALGYSPVLQARREAAKAEWEARPRTPTAKVFFHSDDDSLEVGDVSRLIAWSWHSPQGDVAAETLEGVRLTYASSAPRVARVDSMGRVWALSPGTASISVTGHALVPAARLADGLSDTLRVHVSPANAAMRSLRFVGVAASPQVEFGSSCALGADGSAYCWGYSLDKEAEDGDGAPVGFVRTRGPEPFAAITLGTSHRCAVGRSGRGYCWGDNSNGQLGTGSRRPAMSNPSPVAGDLRWRQIRAGGEHTCGVTVEGGLFCWGSDLAGQLAPASVRTTCPQSLLGIELPSRQRWRCARTPTPVLPQIRFREVAPGVGHTCALEVSGATWCWGENYNHQSGPSAEHQVRSATRIPAPPLARLVAGVRHNCGLDTAGRAYCWGYYQYGNVEGEDPGRGIGRAVSVPVPEPLHALSSGSEHNCGVGRSGRGYCWGDRGRFALGSGATRDEDVPSGVVVPVSGGIRFGAVSVGNDYSCGVSTAGGLYCWGSGLSFRFRGGNLQDHPEPFRLAGPGT